MNIFNFSIRVTNRKQFTLLVERMEEHPSVARGQKFCQASGINREMYNDVWKELTKALNSLGPPIRNEKDWQKVSYLAILEQLFSKSSSIDKT